MAFLRMNPKKARLFLEKQVSTRFWMFILMSGATGAGYLANRLALLSGITHPGWRYGVAVLLSYTSLLLGVRLWLGYVVDWLREADRAQTQAEALAGANDDQEENSEITSEVVDTAGDLLEEAIDEGVDELPEIAVDLAQNVQASITNHAAQIPAVPDSGGGWLHSLVDGIGDFISGIARGIGKGISGIIDGLSGDDALPLLILVLLILIVIAVVGGWVYLIAVAPEILGEVALQFLFSSAILPGLRPAMRYAKGTEEMDHAPWIRALVKKTAIPFGIILVVAMGLGFVMHAENPNARTLKEFLDPPIPAQESVAPESNPTESPSETAN